MNAYYKIKEKTNKSILKPSLIGGKAYQQHLALNDGFSVLDSFVISSDIYPTLDWINQTSDLHQPEKDKQVLSYLNNKGLDLLKEMAEFQTDSFSVRSSATVEDLPEASFAGSFVTKLFVKRKTIADAVLKVWESGYSERVKQYAIDRGLIKSSQNIKVAVLIQPMVLPIYAGVAFSHSIGKSDDPRIMISAVRGVGEPLVSGAVKGQNYWVERLSYRVLKYENAFDLEDFYFLVSDIGSTVERLEILRGVSQDIEFAFDQNKKFILLQNRPITKAL